MRASMPMVWAYAKRGGAERGYPAGPSLSTPKPTASEWWAESR